MGENSGVGTQQQQPVATRTRRFSNNSNSKVNQGDTSRPELKLTDEIDTTKQEGLSHARVCTVDEIVTVLKKEAVERSKEELKILQEWSFLVPEAEARLKARLAKSVIKQRSIEREESMEIIERKADTLAQLIEDANYIVIYTGAGISTSASIPDYRGPNGLWTQIKKTGTFSLTKSYDLTRAEPTFTHMAIKELCKRRIVSHVVSQNCDGLHLRSGIPQSYLSEIHGNMYIEVCPTCEKQYYRQADVTEKTSRFRHKTGRKCHTCPEPNNNLVDTIVLYGERSRTTWPMNWERAGKAAKRADLIICMGSSLKTLRRYFCLWPERNSVDKNSETKLAIINLQYTSKDKNAVLKINGKCDLVMQLVMQKLNIDIPDYEWSEDPLNQLAIPFTPEERANLKRNLIFEFKTERSSESPAPGSLKRSRQELSRSPNLFVSEITDDPEKKRLRMRIRALNSGQSISPSELSTIQDEYEIKPEEMIEHESDEPSKVVNYALPGWLGKSLGATRTSSYRRKRHGNKGRKHSSVLKPQQSLESGATDGDNSVKKTSDVPNVYMDSSSREIDETIPIKGENDSPHGSLDFPVPWTTTSQLKAAKN